MPMRETNVTRQHSSFHTEAVVEEVLPRARQRENNQAVEVEYLHVLGPP